MHIASDVNREMERKLFWEGEKESYGTEALIERGTVRYQLKKKTKIEFSLK